jgi:AP2-associated kinase
MGNLQGKTIKVGSHALLVQKLIAEGGFSFVFLVKDTSTGKQYALKRVLSHDKDQLKVVQNEINIMKMLSHRNIVQYYDSTVVSKGDTTEVYILMEYCTGGHVVDIMNGRHGKRFNEQEILGIFYDTCLAIAHMHAQEPPLAHRDLKVENILLDEANGLFKLCDFGSVTSKAVRPSTKTEIVALEEEIQKYTTLPYRAPEMVDLYQHKLISEKADIWALGCVLYKLAFYTTPFEEGNALQILNVSYTIPLTYTLPQAHQKYQA